MSWGYNDYTPISKKQNNAKKAIERLKKKNPNISPVIIENKKIATTWWGISWNKNLESYADYTSRIKRGSSYVKNSMVLDLQIKTGEINALVQGSSRTPYKVKILIEKLPSDNWNNIVNKCSNKISDISELTEGRFPKELDDIFLKQKEGLFPSPEEIHFDCSCFDWADMCKHVAAVLYGVGHRFDSDPLLFFTLRDIDFSSLLKKSVEQKIESLLKNKDIKSKRIISDADINSLFGL